MKLTTHIFYLSVIAAALLVSNSCKKEVKPEHYKFPIGDETKSYLWGKAGSYWIYKNTSTNDLDTHTCTGFLFDTVILVGTSPDTKHITTESEHLVRNVYSSFNNYKYSDFTILPSPDDPSFNNGFTKFERRGFGGSSITQFFYPFDANLVSGNGYSVTSYLGIDNSLNLQGKTYNNVVKFNIDKDGIWYKTNNSPNAVYYWAKDVGLIKRENKSEIFSWELIDYKIIQ